MFLKLWNAFDGLAKDTLWAGSYDFIQLFVVLFSFTMLQYTLLPEEYGSFTSVYAIVAPLGALSFSGPSLASLKARIRDHQPANPTLRSYITITLILGIASSCIASTLGWIIADDLSIFEIVFIVLSELLAFSFINVLAALIHSSSGYPAMIRVKITTILLKFFIIAFLVFHDSRFVEKYQFLDNNISPIDKFEALTIFNLGLGYLLVYLLFAFWLALFHIKRHGYRFSIGKPVDGAIRTSFDFGGPMAASQLQTEGDKVVMRAFNYTEELGLYSAAYKVVTLGTKPLKALDSAAFQRFLPDQSDVKGMHLRRSIKFATLMFGVSVVLSVGLYLALPLLDILFDEKYLAARDIVPWLLIFIPLVALSGTPMNGLIGLNRTKERSYIYFASSVFSITMYFIFIPPFGWKGAVIATVLSELFLAIVSWIAIVHYQNKQDALMT